MSKKKAAVVETSAPDAPGKAQSGIPRGVPVSPGMPILDLIVFIVDWSKAEIITGILETAHVRVLDERGK